MITYRFRRIDMHMLESPASGETFNTFTYLKNGLKYHEAWYEKSCLHREDGPAEKWYDCDLFIHKEAFYLKGVEYPFKIWLEYVDLDDDTKNLLMEEYGR